MAQGDYNVQNQGFPAFRSDLNSTLSAINTSNSGTSRPSSAVAGTVWLDTTSATTPTLKFYDGADDISLATLDHTANTVNWLDSTVVFDIVGDTTPQLGGDLDVNGNSLVSTSNGNITFTPDGTGKVVISGLSFPTSDGTADQVLKTDGSGNLSFTDVSGGTSWQSSIVTGTTLSAVAGNGYWINTTSNACTITLPSSASVGDTIEIVDYLRTWGTNSITINQNSLNFQGYSSPNPEYNTDGQSVRIVYSGATQGWIPTVDDDVTLEAPQSYSADFLVIAGGGGGGFDDGGAGGAGGYRNSFSTESSGGGGSSETSLLFDIGIVYTVTVGGGGAGASGGSARGVVGVNSSISGSGITTITSSGGGGGGSRPSESTGSSGGSGGGGVGNNGINAGGSGTANQGFAGGTGGTPTSTEGGGGGGASEVGNTDGQGYGGDGLSSSITGSSIARGGGGSGATRSGTAKPAGTGGGGTGGIINSDDATGGTVNTGGGGGGGSGNGETAGSGGSGVVILRMPTASYSGTTTGSPTVSTSGSDTILTFTGSGSYTG